MKIIIAVLALIFSLPLVVAMGNVSEIINTTTPINTSFGPVYLYHPPSPVIEGTNTTIGMIITYNRSDISASVAVENVHSILNNFSSSGDINESQPYYQQEWVLNATLEDAFIVSIEQNATTILRHRLALDVQPRIVVNTSKSAPIKHNITYSEQELARNAYNIFFNTDFSAASFQNSLVKNITISKTSTYITREYNDGTVSTTTLVTIQLSTNRSLQVIEVIPKDVAATADMIITDAIILMHDPVIMWRTSGEQEVTYELQGRQPVTGNTVVTSAVILDEKSSSFPWRIVLPLLLIPLIGGIIFFFSRFEPKK